MSVLNVKNGMTVVAALVMVISQYRLRCLDADVGLVLEVLSYCQIQNPIQRFVELVLRMKSLVGIAAVFAAIRMLMAMVIRNVDVVWNQREYSYYLVVCLGAGHTSLVENDQVKDMNVSGKRLLVPALVLVFRHMVALDPARDMFVVSWADSWMVS